MTLNGYDISAYQGTLNIASVPADFVIIKATGGDGYVNPTWRQQVAEAKAAGRLVGIYHFARDGFTNATASSEANWFIQNTADVIDGTVLTVLDWEGDNVSNVGYAKAWLDQVTAATGVRPLLYASYATINAYDWSSVANANYGLWESAYILGYQQVNGYNPPAGRAAIPYWGTIAEWQYTSSGRLPGWPNDLDLDIFYGDATTWAAYAAKNGTVHPASGGTVTPIQEDDLPYSQWTPEDKAALFHDMWFGVPGAPLIIDRLTGQGAWPETYLGSLRQRIDTDIDGHVDDAVKAIPTGTVTLTDAQVQNLADKLTAALPAADLALLKSKL